MTNTTPSPENLRALKEELGKPQTYVAELCGFTKKTTPQGRETHGQKWRKLTLESDRAGHKKLSSTAFFHLAAHLVLSKSELKRVEAEMNRICELKQNN